MCCYAGRGTIYFPSTSLKCAAYTSIDLPGSGNEAICHAWDHVELSHTSKDVPFELSFH